MTWLDNARVAAIFAVVLLHIAARVVLEQPVGYRYWWFGNIYDAATRWCVPVLVMISGALLLDPGKNEDLPTFYRKRMSRILWPILFWSVFYLFWVWLKGIRQGDPPQAVDLARSLLSGRPYFHMWFLYMILGLYLFTPFLRKVVAHATRRELIIVVCVMFAIAAVNAIYRKVYPDSGPGLFINWFLDYLPYFIAGHIIRSTTVSPPRLGLVLMFGLSFLAIVFGCYFVTIRSNLSTGFYFYDNLSVPAIPMATSIMLLLKTWEAPLVSKSFTATLSSLTMGVYLIHPVILEVIYYKVPGAMATHPAVAVPAVAVVVFAACVVATGIIQRIPYVRRIV